MILDRPIFRQQGGPIMEAPMPPDPQMQAPMPPMPPDPQMQAPMPPDPQMQEALQAAESQAAAEGEQIGQEYLQGINSLLDGAQNYEEMINAMRGNAMPLQARYNELADFVGEADASSTPESVLTLVQPTIMMSEEGAVDSGVGSLMQEVVGGMGMEEQPQMTQGLGELMVAGQPEMPVPVQNFQQGSGPGGVRSPRAYMEEYLPLYEEIMGSSEEADRRRLNLDIARAGFAFAGGVDPSTGKSVAGQPVLSQLGVALDPIAKGQGERIAAQRKADQAARLAALQSGLSARESEKTRLSEAAAADLAYQRDLAAKAFANNKPMVLSPGAVLVSPDGQLLAENIKGDKDSVITVAPGHSVFDTVTNKPIFTAPSEEQSKRYTLSPGETLYDADGNVIATGSEDGDNEVILSPGQSIVRDGKVIYTAPPEQQTVVLSKGQELIDEASGKVIATGKDEQKTVTVSPGQSVINAVTGEVLYTAPDDEKDNVFGRGREGLVMELLSDEAAMMAWGNNAAEGAEGQQTNRNIEAALVDYLTPQTVFDPESGTQVKKTNPPTPLMITAYEQRKKVDPSYSLPVMETALTKVTPLAGTVKDDTDAPEPYPEDSAWAELEAGIIDPTRATGTNAWVANVLNTLTGVFEDLGVETAYPGAEKLQAALKVLNTETVMVFKEANEGRENRPIDDMIRELSPGTGEWTMSDKRSLEKWRSLRGMFGEAKAQLDDQLKDPNLTQDKRVQKEWALRKTGDLIRKYDTLIRLMEPAIATQSGQAPDIDIDNPKYLLDPQLQQ